MKIIQTASPNFGPRRGCSGPDMVVLHYTAMATAGEALERMCDPAAEVSAHYLVGEDGRVFQLVTEEQRAWHAGVSTWGGEVDVNSHSIGIELANPASLAGFPPFTAPQMRALEGLLEEITKRWRIAPSRVLGHSDVAPGRKADPGPKFDWRRLALAGLAVWPQDDDGAHHGDIWEAFSKAAHLAGYRCREGGEWAEVLHAVRLRFRPWAAGSPISAADLGVIRNLARLHPCIDPAAPVT